MGPTLQEGKSLPVCIGAMFVAPQFELEYIQATTSNTPQWTALDWFSWLVPYLNPAISLGLEVRH
jgi:hypothetical protein